MNLIFIYGPPAVGKLTIAEQLATLTGYKLFHNHLTQDLAREIYPDFDYKRFNLADKLRLDVFEYAAKNDTNLIFTYVYDNVEQDETFVKNTIKTVMDSDGAVCFVQLKAPKDVLLNRVGDDSRKKYHKIQDKDKFSSILDINPLDSKIDSDNVLIIDTSEQNAMTSALQIVDYFKL